MNVPEPPRIVVESRASCSDAEHVEDLLRNALATARAPGHAWTVKMSVQPTAAPAVRTLRAQGEITDESGIRVAGRVLSVPAGDCRGLARAVGVWASLVLEQELSRDHASTRPASPTPQVADSEPAEVFWPAPAEPEKAPPEREWYLHHEESRDIELGFAGFLMTGAGAGAMVGASPYAIVEMGRGVFLRPAFAFGESFQALNSPPIVHALWMTGRVDTCLRIPGLYTRNRGIQLDLCGGADVGLLDDATDHAVIPYVSLGPSVDLRGELGSLLSTTLRAVAGLNVTSETSGVVYQPLASARLELAFSWKVE